jgi:hypothetical protein
MTEANALQVRLDGLPRKIGVPFQDLLARGYITEQLLDVILDASEIADDQTKLLGFAIGYLNLRQSGVPISDVVKMSKSLGRKIRLDWSIKRWRSEHDRLSRAVALSRMAEENTTYDLSRYDEVISDPFPGYLVRTSRRLGMEGLRQRHCVASYDRQLQNGYCAIASVFVNKKRWTVQLQLTGKPEAPLRISQIRTLLNGLASPEERTAIHEMFGIDESPFRSAQVAPRPSAESTYMRNLRNVLPVLRTNQVERVTVHFDGYGDSGQIDSVSFEPDSFSSDGVDVPFVKADQVFEDGQWNAVYEEVNENIATAIETITYDYIDEVGVDISNNDGGWADLAIDVDEGTVSMEVNTRFTDSNCAHDVTKDIETGEELE